VATISLGAYTIRVRRHREEDYLPLDDLPGGLELFSLLRSFLGEIAINAVHNETEKRLITARAIQHSGSRIQALLETGEYGYESDLLSAKTRKKRFRRGRDDAEMLPFHLEADLPHGSTTGLLVLQRFKTFGIRRAFEKTFTSWLSTRRTAVVIEINPLLSTEAAAEIAKQNGVKKIRLIRRAIPKDLADRVKFLDGKEVLGSMEIVLKAHAGLFYRLKTAAIDAKKGQTTLKGYDELLEQLDCDAIKVEVSTATGSRVLDFSNMMKLRTTYDISNEVRLGKDGHPELESIREISSDYLTEIRASITGD
jgi:hypothetical protein